jgi:hypothetical protein
MESATTKIDNIIDQLMNHNYSAILKNIKKLLSKNPNQSPTNFLLIDMLRALSFYNLRKFKKAEDSIKNALKYAEYVTLDFFSKYHFLFGIVLTQTLNEESYDKFMDLVVELDDKVSIKENDL